MELEEIITKCIVGLIVGIVAGLIMKKKMGLIRCMITGVLGAFVGSWIVSKLNIDVTGYWNYAVQLGGACIVIILTSLLW